jgi:hypothetical protein
MSKKEDTDPTTFSDKWSKVLKSLPEFKDTADAAGMDELKKIIIDSESNIYTVDKEMEADVKLIAANELKKDLAAGYREAKKVQNCKIQYALFLLECKGVEMDKR